ncbi:acylphosphatase [Desulfurobacterium thermolithotrophum]|uniref:acylphosphatase n=1 Tax=Desulfurobacterium thermolithotrophum TaxID=64160 RepID=UPI0013D1687F
MKALHAIISGRVQGVGYRAFTKNKAKLLGLKGFVKNLPDGRVEVYAEGEEEKLYKLLNYLREGFLLSNVVDIKFQLLEARRNYADFNIIH